MNKYICTVCGYIFDESGGTLWDDLPSNWVCPLCGADKSAFELQQEEVSTPSIEPSKVDEELRDIQSYEMAALCSNLAKGCEKQHFLEEANAFLEIEKYFSATSHIECGSDLPGMIEDLNSEIAETFKVSNAMVDIGGSRGSKRALVWSEKVSRMLKSVLTQYEKEGDAYLENTKIHVCEICGFIFVGDDLPAVCPVCKVPNFKMKEIGRE